MAGALSGQTIGPVSEKVEKRFKSKLLISPDTACIVYQGADRNNGYKGFYVTRTRQVLAHRLAYTLFVGPLTPGMVINHKCGNHACCAPDHLEEVTQYENSEKGDSWKRKTHCVNGHEFTPENTYWRINAGGYRVQRCVACSGIKNPGAYGHQRGRPKKKGVI